MSTETDNKNADDQTTVLGDAVDGTKNEEDGNKNLNAGDQNTDANKATDDTDNNKDDKSGDKDGKQEGAPETYEAFKIPEGFKLSDERSAALTEFAKEQNWSQESAQSAVDMHIKFMQESEAAMQDALKAQSAEWINSVKTDKEIGGDKFDENLAVAAKARDAFFSKEFVEFINHSGLGNHPEMIRGLYKVGRAMSDDKLETGGDPSKTGNRLASMYPSMAEK